MSSSSEVGGNKARLNKHLTIAHKITSFYIFSIFTLCNIYIRHQSEIEHTDKFNYFFQRL